MSTHMSVDICACVCMRVYFCTLVSVGVSEIHLFLDSYFKQLSYLSLQM